MIEREELVLMVRRAQNGDSEAAARLYETFQKDLYYFIFKTVKNDKELAEDLTQDTFMEILESLPNLQEPAAFVTWSKQIAYHKCTDYFKKRKELLADEDEDGYSVFDTVEEEHEEFIPDAALDSKELKQTILDMVNQLPEEQRAAILLRYFNEISVKEIAQVQQVSEGTVKSRLNYARKAIKQAVESYEKKNGIKLHCAGVIPLLLWLFREYRLQRGLSLTTKTASAVFAASEGAVASAAVGTAAGATSAAVKTAASIGVKLAGKALGTKIVAAVAALAVAAGGTTAVVSSIKGQEAPQSAYVETLPAELEEEENLPAAAFDESAQEAVPAEETEPTEETLCEHTETERVNHVMENGRFLGQYSIVCTACGEVIAQGQDADYNEGYASDEEAKKLLEQENGSIDEGTEGTEEEPEDEFFDECVNHNYVAYETWTDPNTGVVYTFHSCTVCGSTYSSSGTPGTPDYEVGNGAPDGYYAEQNGNTEISSEETE